MLNLKGAKHRIMQTFVIVPSVDSVEFDSHISAKFETKAFRLPKGEWLVAYEGTSKQLSDDLGISEKESGWPASLVLNFSGYWGRAGKDVWEWISVNGG